jgi:hypothetical protein
VLHLRVPEVVEEASTVTEHQRNDVQLKFVQQSRCQVPLPDLSISHDIPVPAAKQNSAARPGSVLKFATSAARDDPVGSAICVGKREGSSIVRF